METKCFYCRRKMIRPKKGQVVQKTPALMTKDHLIPKKIMKCGKVLVKNTVRACRECNQKKGHMTSFEFMGLKWMRYMFQDAAKPQKYYAEYKTKVPF